MTDDRLPPHDIESEKGALGVAILNPGAIVELNLDWFYLDQHRVICQALVDLALAGLELDSDGTIIHLIHKLQEDGKLDEVGGAGGITELTDHAPTTWNMAYHAPHLTRLMVQRKLARFGNETASEAMDGTSADYHAKLEELKSRLEAIRPREDAGEVTPIKNLVQLGMDRIELVHQNQGVLMGVPSGFPDLDWMTNGFQRGDFIILAARPSIGKTSLVMNIAEHVAVDVGLPVLVFSLEMEDVALILRMQCSRARVSMQHAMREKLEDIDMIRFLKTSPEIGKSPLYINRESALNTEQLASRAKELVQRNGIRLIIVDYIGLISGSGKYNNRYEMVTGISNRLKGLAREVNLPLIALCQLNRDMEKSGREPVLADLRDSGALEQDADIVMLLHRVDDPSKDFQEAKLIIAKQRNGPTGPVNLLFQKRFTRFESVAKIDREDTPSKEKQSGRRAVMTDQ
jgi:replicative DNA helicase